MKFMAMKLQDKQAEWLTCECNVVRWEESLGVSNYIHHLNRSKKDLLKKTGS